MVRTRLRSAVFSLLGRLGVLQLYRFIHRKKVLILMLHGVMDEEVSALWTPLRRQLSRSRLEAYLDVLSRHYRFVSLQDAVEMLTGRKPLLAYSVVLTFDDGYRNNLKHALPVLQRYGAPATFFVATSHVENRIPYWFDRLDYAIQHSDMSCREFQIGEECVHFGSNDRDELGRAYRSLRQKAKGIERPDWEMLEELERIASDLEGESGCRLAEIFEEDEWSGILSWEEVRQAASDGVCIGSHSADHVRLGLAEGEVVRDQLVRSKEAIEAHIGSPCRYFCYPSGSFGGHTIEMVRECGYEAAVTTMEGFNRVGDNPMALRRISLPAEATVPELMATLCGLTNAKKLIEAVFHPDAKEHGTPECLLGD